MRTLSYLNFVLAAVFARLLLLPGGVRPGAAAGKAPALPGPETVPLRGAHRRQERGGGDRPAHREHLGGRITPGTWWTCTWWRTTAPTTPPRWPGPTGPPCSSGRIKNWWERATPCAFCWSRSRRRGACYDGYFVFDADNLLDPQYISQMNKVFSSGARAVTSYRNSKNFGDNWITAGYGLWFLRESEYLNRPRDVLGTSCAVSGTGFLFSQQLLEELGGWNYFLLTEGPGVYRRPGGPGRAHRLLPRRGALRRAAQKLCPSPSGSGPGGSGGTYRSSPSGAGLW